MADKRHYTRRMIWLVVAVSIISLLSAASILAQGDDGQTHIVQPGETLFSIARRYGLTVEQVAFANGITNPALIYVGQELVIPTGGAGGTTSYTIAAGDTLFSIARRFNTTVDELVSLNGLTDPSRIQAGQVIRVPGTGATATPPPTQPATVTATATQVPATTAPSPTPSPTATTPPTQPPPVQPVYHVVQAGESLLRFALRYGMTYQQLAQLNGITNPNLIFPGQRLLIRSGNEPQPTPTSTQGATPTVQASPTAGGGTQQPTQTPTQQSATEAPTSVVVNTATPTPTQTATFTPTATLTPTATVVPTVDTFDGIPTPTPINPAAVIPPSAPNLLASASFEGSTREVVFPEIQVVDGWEPFYCDLPYTPQKCPALNQGSGNPQGLTMGRPSFTDTREAARVRSGTAQQWACPWKSCRGGVFQTIATTAGATCEVGAYVQSLSTGGTSMVSTVTDNSIWLIRVDLNGGTNAFAQGTHMLASRGFEFADGHYDQYVKITYTFQATGSQTTIFFENLRIWPIEVNQSFIDDAYVRCSS